MKIELLGLLQRSPELVPLRVVAEGELAACLGALLVLLLGSPAVLE